MQIEQRPFLIAGGSGGLGSALADELARRGARLALAARDADRLARVPVEAVRISADLRLPSEAERAVSEAVGELGPLAGVLNAAGVVAFGPFAEISTDVWEEIQLANAFLPAFLFQAAIPHLDDPATLVNLSGVVAEQPMAGMAAYSSAKAAASALLAALRRELRRQGVQVIDARPGHTETGLADHPIDGTAPSFREGLAPADVARRIVDAIAEDERDLPPDAFT